MLQSVMKKLRFNNNVIIMEKYNSFAVNLFIMLILTQILLSCNNSNTTQSYDKNNDTHFSSSILLVENKKLDLGEINKRDKTTIPFKFALRNESNNTIVIDKVDVSCSCVKIVDYSKRLEAGESSELIGEINLKNQSGHIRKSIFINYSDTCLTVLRIVADILD